MEKNEDLRRNAKTALAAVADWPEGFLKITEQMAGKLDLLDEVVFTPSHPIALRRSGCQIAGGAIAIIGES